MSEKLTAAQREANLMSTVRFALANLCGADYPARRRGVMAVAAMLGHRMGVEQLRDQPWGTVGQCANCGQIAKAPMVGDTIEGRATFTFCPANRLTEAV
jgi:hypothetical protein